ncbi:MAG: hypothetical protein GF308_09240 [Candidatus Heimdallarchaeota archaeon]|nr:hypothetical protein [Candidatus Heimdallarchaeota archaeon]
MKKNSVKKVFSIFLLIVILIGLLGSLTSLGSNERSSNHQDINSSFVEITSFSDFYLHENSPNIASSKTDEEISFSFGGTTSGPENERYRLELPTANYTDFELELTIHYSYADTGSMGHFYSNLGSYYDYQQVTYYPNGYHFASTYIEDSWIGSDPRHCLWGKPYGSKDLYSTNPSSMSISGTVIFQITRTDDTLTCRIKDGDRITKLSHSWSQGIDYYANFFDILCRRESYDSDVSFTFSDIYGKFYLAEGGTAPPTTTTSPPPSGYDWVIMTYLDGDNNLEENAIDDFNELEQGIGSSSSIAIIVLFDRISGHDYSNSDWTSTRLYEITYDSTSYINSILLEEKGELNMGDETTLQSFINYGFEHYSADHYWLNLWNHGGSVDGICWDDTNNNDALTLEEMQAAIAASETLHNKTFDLISHDACFMNALEVGYELRDLADVFVASEESVPGDGFDYETIISELVTNPSINANSLASIIVNAYENQYDFSTDYVALSTLNLQILDNLTRYVNDFAGNLSEVILDGQGAAIQEAFFETLSFYDYYCMDFKHFVENILNKTDLLGSYPALNVAATNLLDQFPLLILENYQHACYEGNANGLAIFMPYYNSIYESYIDNYLTRGEEFQGMDWQIDSQWDEFLDDFYSAGLGQEEIGYGILELGILSEIQTLAEDEDFYYGITLDQLAVYSIEATIFEGDGDLYLLDATDYGQIAYSVNWNPEDGNNEEICIHLQPGTYIILLYAYSETTYNVIMEMETVETISEGETVEGSGGTQEGDFEDHFCQIVNHYYQFTITSPASYSFELSYDSDLVDFDLYILNTQYEIQFQSESTGDVDNLNIDFSTPTTVIICIYGYSGNGSFEFKVTEIGVTNSDSPSNIISGYTLVLSIISFVAIGLILLLKKRGDF